jgi:hypothetical protein
MARLSFMALASRLFLWDWGFKLEGAYAGMAVNDIARTLAAILAAGIPSGSEGRIQEEISKISWRKSRNFNSPKI